MTTTRTMIGMLAALVLVLALGACAETGVGDPCALEVEPLDGIQDNDTIIETSSMQCRTRACMAFNREVFCTQRCDSDQDCNADWYEEGPGRDDVPSARCEATIDVGASGVRGSWCVPDWASKTH